MKKNQIRLIAFTMAAAMMSAPMCVYANGDDGEDYEKYVENLPDDFKLNNDGSVSAATEAATEEKEPEVDDKESASWHIHVNAGGVVMGDPITLKFTVSNGVLEENSQKMIQMPESVTLCQGNGSGEAVEIGQMMDDGNAPDQTAGDGIYTMAAEITVDNNDQDALEKGLDFFARINYAKADLIEDPTESSSEAPADTAEGSSENSDEGAAEKKDEGQTDTDAADAGVSSNYRTDIAHLIVIPSTDRDLSLTDQLEADCLKEMQGITGRADGQVLKSQMGSVMEQMDTVTRMWLEEGRIIYLEYDKEGGMITMQLPNGQFYIFRPNPRDSLTDEGTANTRWIPNGNFTTSIPFQSSSETTRFEVFYSLGDNDSLTPPQISLASDGTVITGVDSEVEGYSFRTRQRIGLAGYDNLYYDVYYLTGAGAVGKTWNMQITVDPEEELLVIAQSQVPENWETMTMEYKTQAAEPMLWLDQSNGQQYISQISNIIAAEAPPAEPQPEDPEPVDTTGQKIRLGIILGLVAAAGIGGFLFYTKRNSLKDRAERRSRQIARVNSKYRNKKNAEENDLDGYVDFADDDADDGGDAGGGEDGDTDESGEDEDDDEDEEDEEENGTGNNIGNVVSVPHASNDEFAPYKDDPEDEPRAEKSVVQETEPDPGMDNLSYAERMQKEAAQQKAAERAETPVQQKSPQNAATPASGQKKATPRPAPAWSTPSADAGITRTVPKPQTGPAPAQQVQKPVQQPQQAPKPSALAPQPKASKPLPPWMQ